MAFSSHDILGFDYVQHFVGSAKHTANYYAGLYGFEIVGYAGPETGIRDRVSYLLKQNDLVFIITSAIVPDHDIQKFISKHGDGICEISIRTKDPKVAFDHAVANGAEAVEDVKTVSDENGRFTSAKIKIYGDTVLALVDRSDYRGVLPGFGSYDGPQFSKGGAGLQAIDHIVGNVGVGEMDVWAKFFEETLDLETYIHFDEGDISTQFSALVSKVVRSKNSSVRFPINEPAEGLKKSQIEEYLEVNYGPGVQHVAIATHTMVDTIASMESRGVEFIATPQSYYDLIGERSKGIDEQLEILANHSILLDRDDQGYLLQLFTQPVGDRPTLFYEIIQRKGCEGFGQNNFQSLFEAIEREQAKRGNL